MIRFSSQAAPAEPSEGSAQSDHIGPVPRISIQAFCESADTAAVIESTIADRRMAKAHLKVQMGGIVAAGDAYRAAPTPNVIALEAGADSAQFLAGLDGLAESCDPGTRVVVLGKINDVSFYRELVRRQVSDYLLTPIEPLEFIRTLSNMFGSPDAKPVGRMIAVAGAKGGVGASTVAHNIGWALARGLSIDTVVADLDLPFGTAGLDYNQDPPQGVADAVFAPERVDTAFVDRLLSKCTDHLSLLASPATLERVYDFDQEAFDAILDVLRASVPCTVLDVPHVWSGWTRRMLISADEILLVAAPDLANLRNIKNMIDLMRSQRPNDARPHYCLNQVAVPKRPEIKAADFAKALEFEPVCAVPFDPQVFGTAANNGQMIAEVAAGHRANAMFNQLAQVLSGRGELKRAKAKGLSPILNKLIRRSA